MQPEVVTFQHIQLWIGIIALVASLIGTMIGAVISYSALKYRVNFHSKRIEELRKQVKEILDTMNGTPDRPSKFILRGDCESNMKIGEETLEELRKMFERSMNQIERLLNHARYNLAKEGKSQIEINQILGNGGPK